jgi:hypothetical protein
VGFVVVWARAVLGRLAGGGGGGHHGDDELLKFLVPVDNFRSIVNRGLLYKDAHVYFGSLRLLETLLERMDACCAQGTPQEISRNLQAKARARVPGFSVLLKKVVEHSKRPAQDGVDATGGPAAAQWTATRRSLMNCLRLYLRLFPSSASDSQFDASRLIEGLGVTSLDEALLGVVDEAAKRNLFRWNVFLRDNHKRSALRMLTNSYVHEKHDGGPGLAKDVLANSIFGAGCFKYSYGANAARTSRAELDAWLDGLGDHTVALFDEAICRVVKNPLAFAKSSGTSALTGSMLEQLRRECEKAGGTALPAEYICESIAELEMTCCLPESTSRSVLKGLPDTRKGMDALLRADGFLASPHRALLMFYERMRARGHVPDVAHVSRALRETQDSAKCAAPFDADFDAAGDVPEFSAGVEAAVQRWYAVGAGRSPFVPRPAQGAVLDAVVGRFCEYFEANSQRLDGCYFARRLFRILHFWFQWSVFDVPAVHRAVSTGSELSRPLLGLLAGCRPGTLLAEAVFCERVPLSLEPCREAVQRCFDAADARAPQDGHGALPIVLRCTLELRRQSLAARPVGPSVFHFVFGLLSRRLGLLAEHNVEAVQKNAWGRVFAELNGVDWAPDGRADAVGSLLVLEHVCRLVGSHAARVAAFRLPGFGEFCDKMGAYVRAAVDAATADGRVGGGEREGEKLALFSAICSLLKDRQNHDLAVYLVAKLKERRGSFAVTRLHRKLLALVATGASRSLKSTNAALAIDLLDTCVAMNCVGDDSALDETCHVLIDRLTVLPSIRFAAHVPSRFFKFCWNHCNRTRASTIVTLASRLDHFYREALALVIASQQGDQGDDPAFWVARLPVLFAVLSLAVARKHPAPVLSSSTVAGVLSLVMAHPPVLPSATADLACATYRMWWAHCAGAGAAVDAVAHPTGVFDRCVAAVRDLADERRKPCGFPIALLVQSVKRMGGMSPAEVAGAHLRSMAVGMQQLVLLGSSSKAMPRRAWTAIVSSSVSYFTKRGSVFSALGEGRLEPLVKVFPAFVRACLKYQYGAADAMALLEDSVALVYSRRELLASAAISPTHCFDMITGHSKFIHTVGETAETWVFRVLFRLLQHDENCLDQARAENVFPVLLKHYGASLSERDSLIAQILLYHADQFPEKNYLKTLNYAWGDALALQRSVTSAASSNSSSQSMWVFNADVGVRSDRLVVSNDNFPANRRVVLDELDVPGDGEYDRKVYDPAFVLAAVEHCLALNSRRLDLKGLFSNTKIVQYAIRALASACPFVRSKAYSILSRVFAKLEYHASKYAHNVKDPFPQSQEIATLLRCLKRAITAPEQRLPGIIAAFVSEGLGIAQRPNHRLYPLMNKFLLSRPCIDLSDVPMYYSLFNSGTPSYRTERMWILRILGSGDRSDLDLTLLSRRHVYGYLMALSSSPMSDDVTEPVLLKAFSCIANAPNAPTELGRRGFLHWLQRLALKAPGFEHTSLAIDMLFSLMNDEGAEVSHEPKKRALFGMSVSMSVVFIYRQLLRALVAQSNPAARPESPPLLGHCNRLLRLGVRACTVFQDTPFLLSYEDIWSTIQIYARYKDAGGGEGELLRQRTVELLVAAMPKCGEAETEHCARVMEWFFANAGAVYDRSPVICRKLGRNVSRTLLEHVPASVLRCIKESPGCRKAAFGLQSLLYQKGALLPTLCLWKGKKGSNTIRKTYFEAVASTDEACGSSPDDDAWRDMLVLTQRLTQRLDAGVADEGPQVAKARPVAAGNGTPESSQRATKKKRSSDRGKNLRRSKRARKR